MPLLLALAAAAAVPQPGALKLFGDWTVGCDNGRTCQAVALMPEETVEGASTLVLTRGPEADAPVQVRIVTPDGIPATAEAGEKIFSLVPTAEGIALRRGDARALIATFRRADRLVLRDARGRALGPVSLKGAMAALQWIDERQQRLGTVTALVKPGPKPAGTVPPPPELPVVRAAPPAAKPPPKLNRAALIKAHTDPSCGASFDPETVEIARLDAQNTLAVVPDRCGSGAYNIAHVVLIADNKGRVRPAKFETPPGWGEDGSMAVNAGWDISTRRLTTFAKARGLGDCGASQSFVWDGTNFRLAEFSHMGECRGSGDWIVTWRAQIR